MASKGGGYKGPRKWKTPATQQQRADGAGNHAAQGAGTRQAGTQSREGVPPVEDNAVFMLQAAVAAAVVMKWHNAIHLWAMQHATRSGWHKALRLTLPTGKPEALEPIVPDPTEYDEDEAPQYRADKMRYEAEIKRHLAKEELIVEQGQLIVGKMLSLMTEECKSRITMRFGQLALNGDDPVELMERVEQSIAGHATGTNASTRAYEARQDWGRLRQRGHETVTAYFSWFCAQTEGLKRADRDNGVTPEQWALNNPARAIVTHFLMTLNRERYGKEQDELKWSHAGRPFPATLDAALERAMEWEEKYKTSVGHERRRINAYAATTRSSSEGGRARSAPQGGSSARDVPLCRAFLRGNCTYPNCKYKHDKEAAKAHQAEHADGIKEAVGEVRKPPAGGGPAPKGAH